MDFTIKSYKALISSIIDQGYSFETFSEFIKNGNSNGFVLRHDVDKLPYNSLHFAEIQNELGIKGSYYFRAVPQSWDENIILKIHDLGHEVGYHYENLSTTKGNMTHAIKDFEKNLKNLRKLVPVSTICMHGSPLSKYDNRDIWKEYNYKDYGIIGEPYFGVDFSKTAYYTDTGRRWDGGKVSVRDNPVTRRSAAEIPIASAYRGNSTPATMFPSYHSTQDIIKAVQKNTFPSPAMFTFHPQRWTDNRLLWTKEIVMQNVKNMVKYFIVRGNKNN